MYTVQANGLSPKCVFMCCPLCSAYEKALEHRAQAIVFLLNVFSNFNLEVQFVKKIFWCSSEVRSILIWKFVGCWLVGIGHVQTNSFWMNFWSQIDIEKLVGYQTIGTDCLSFGCFVDPDHHLFGCYVRVMDGLGPTYFNLYVSRNQLGPWHLNWVRTLLIWCKILYVLRLI